MRFFRPLAAALMVALLVLTGQQITAAKATGPAVMQAVLCIGGGLITVHLDADGNPVGPAHVCPDATLAFLPDSPAPSAAGAVRHLDTLTPPTLTARAPDPGLRGLPPARGPPLPV